MKFRNSVIPLAVVALFPLLLLLWDKPFLIGEGILEFSAPKTEITAIKQTLNLYYDTLQDFFASDGDPAMIDRCPASKILKHEIFKEIGMMRDNGRIAVCDLASSKIERLRFTAPDQAEVTTREMWALQYQTSDRKPTGPITSFERIVTYRLKKGEKGWRVMTWEPVP